MIRLLSAACGLALLGTPAVAQTATQTAAPAPGTLILAQHGSDGYGWRNRRDWRAGDDDNGPDDRMSDRGSDHSDDRAGDRDRSGGWRDGPDRAGEAGHMAHRPPPPPPPHERGLHLRMRRGDAAIDLRCPASDDYSSCISAVGQLIDKLDARSRGGMATGGAAGSSSGGSGSSAPAPSTPTPDTPSSR